MQKVRLFAKCFKLSTIAELFQTLSLGHNAILHQWHGAADQLGFSGDSFPAFNSISHSSHSGQSCRSGIPVVSASAGYSNALHVIGAVRLLKVV